MSSRFHRLLAILLVGLFSVPAVAQYTKDKSANLKIDEAVNTHYFNGEMEKAETLLKGIVDACADKCSPQTKAKAWMYVGVVRGGSDNQPGAKEAFTQAKGLDPAVQLDRDLASPDTQATFDGVPGGTAPVVLAPVAAGAVVPGDMKCTPDVRDVPTRSALPISCKSDADVATAELRFKEAGGETWKKIAMTKVGDLWQAEIGCEITTTAGDFHFYVGAKDAAGEYVDQYGSKKQPASFQLLETGGTAPAFPGKTAAPRCAAASDCPPDFPGCATAGAAGQCGEKDWGASCGASSECKCGLSCQNGSCENAQACSSDAECGSGGSCVSGKCSGSTEEAPAEFKKFWLGLGATIDLTSFGGPSLCTLGQNAAYNTVCINPDNTVYNDDGSASPLGAAQGTAMGQIRPGVSFDYAFTDHFTAGARVAFAIGGHPGSEPKSFNFLDIQARGQYYFKSLSKKGVRPFAYLGFGYAGMDGKIQAASGVTIYKLAGNFNANAGLGLGYAFTPNVQLAATVGGGLYFAPYTWYAIQPGISATYGF